jgi:uncharacterized protein YjdB
MQEPLEGVTATILYELGYDPGTGKGNGEWAVWDAEWYLQVNPQNTPSNGWYEWFVPRGNWMVVYEKEGYKTEYSEVMHVPPIWLDVHQPMESIYPAQFEGAYWTEEADSFRIVFDKYVKVDDINEYNVILWTNLTSDGTELGVKDFLNGTFVPVDPAEYKGEDIAKEFLFVPEEGYELDVQKAYSVEISPGVRAYSDIPLGLDADGEKYTKEVTDAPPVKVKGISLETGRFVLMAGGEGIQASLLINPLNAADKTVTWTSSDTNVATIDSDGNITPLSAGVSFITATTNDGGFSVYGSIYVEVGVIGVELDIDELTIAENSSYVKLTATVSPSDAAETAVTWTSSDENVATVDIKGRVMPVGIGTCTITVTTTEGGFTDTCDVKVIAGVPVEGVSLEYKDIFLAVGDTFQLTAAISPEGATNKNVIWTDCGSGNAGVADGLVTALKNGVCVITVTTQDGSKTAQCVVRIIDIVGVPSEAIAGTSLTMTGMISPDISVGRTIVWSVRDPGETGATLSEGVLTAAMAGTVVMTATVAYLDGPGSYARDFTITVNAAPVVLTGISVTGPAMTTYILGETLDLTGLVVTAAYSDSSSKPVTGYTTSPADGDTLDAVGTIPVTVTYIEGDITKIASFTVEVKEPELDSIAITTTDRKSVV